MPSNKKRLYVALYPSGVLNNEERKYHWGFLVGPKDEKHLPVAGMRYHVKNLPSAEYPSGAWVYEERDLPDVTNTINLLGRILIGKIEDERKLLKIFESNRIVQGDPDWRCRSWVAEVLSRTAKDGKAVGTSQLDWATIESTAREYIASKTAAGRYESSSGGPKPTYDLIERREVNS